MTNVNINDKIKVLLNEDLEQVASVEVQPEEPTKDQGVEDVNVPTSEDEAGSTDGSANDAGSDSGQSKKGPEQAAAELDRIAEESDSKEPEEGAGKEGNEEGGEKGSEEGSEEDTQEKNEDSEEVDSIDQGDDDVSDGSTDEGNSDSDGDSDDTADVTDSSSDGNEDDATSASSTDTDNSSDDSSDDGASNDSDDAVEHESNSESDEGHDASTSTDEEDTVDETFNENSELVEEQARKEASGDKDSPVNEIDRASRTIREAREISDRLARLAQTIVDRYPESNESVNTQIDQAVLNISRISLESIQSQTEHLVNEAVNIEEKDPLVAGTERALKDVAASLKNASEQMSYISEVREQIGVIKEKTQGLSESEPVSSVTLSDEVFETLSIDGEFNLRHMQSAGLLLRVMDSLKQWTKETYVEDFIFDLIKTGEAKDIRAPYLPDLNDSNVTLKDRIQASFNIHSQDNSKLLPGNRVLLYWCSLDVELESKNNRVGPVRLVYLPPINTVVNESVNKPNKGELEQIQLELTDTLSAMVSSDELLKYLSGVCQAFGKWLKDASTEETQSLAIETLLKTVEPVVDISLYLRRYAQALVEYANS